MLPNPLFSWSTSPFHSPLTTIFAPSLTASSATPSLPSLADPEFAKKIFSAFDKNSDGFITSDDIQSWASTREGLSSIASNPQKAQKMIQLAIQKLGLPESHSLDQSSFMDFLIKFPKNSVSAGKIGDAWMLAAGVKPMFNVAVFKHLFAGACAGAGTPFSTHL